MSFSINDNQFSGLYDQALAQGGFTAIPKGRFAGMAPRNKFMVGQRDVPEGEATSGPGIREYTERNEKILDRPDRAIGGWGYQGKVVLDVPKSFPGTPKGEVNARKSTLANTQKAYGVMGPDRTYAGTIYNPYDEAHQDPFNQANVPDTDETPEANATKYFAGDRRLWTEQPVRRERQ